MVDSGYTGNVGCAGGYKSFQQVAYLAQIVVVYSVIVVSIINLTFGCSEHTSLWVSLLSGNIGYILPAPKPHRWLPRRRHSI